MSGFGDFRIADIVAIHCAAADIECRRELQRKTIVSERDYVSNLTSKIRTALSSSRGLSVHTQTIDPRFENKFGVDGIMVFRLGNKAKVGIFEAKWPRLTESNYSWDYIQNNISHFSDQIERQSVWGNELAVWEMFFNESIFGNPNPSYDHFGSSCVWHHNAYSHMHREQLIFKKWTTDDLQLLIRASGLNFYSIIYSLLSCQMGKVFTLNKGGNSLTVQGSQDSFMEIPLPIETGEQTNQRISSFLIERKIDSYLFVDASSVDFGNSSWPNV